MSHDGIERAYEEDLKAEMRWLHLYIGGRWQRNEPDTPAGRVRMDKHAFKARLVTPDNVKVEVTRGAAGERIANRPESTEGQRPSILADPKSVPAAAPVTSDCCEPVRYAGPSGIRLRHRFYCPVAPGAPWRALRAAESPDRLSRIHRTQDIRSGLDEALSRHPAGGTLTVVSERCPAHPGERWDDCPTCSEREA